MRFLKLLEKESIRKLQVLQILLLILRTIIILCIIMMISRPVINGIFNLQNSGESALHAIILDDSFSMSGNRENIQHTVRKILNQIPDKNQLIFINTNGGLKFKGLREDIPPFESLVKSTFLGESVNNSLNILKVNSEGEFTSKELYILTDGQNSSIKALIENSDQLDSFHIYSFIAPKIENNLSVVKLHIVNEILLPNNQMEIEVSVQNSGVANIENRLLQLIINEMIVGQQLISIKSGNTKIFTFKTALSKSGSHSGIVEIDRDNRMEDNRFYFTLNIPNRHKVAIISDSKESSYYIRESLNALNKYGESLIISEFIDFNSPQLKIYEQDIIFHLNPEILGDISDSKIEEYLYNGGHLVIFPHIYSDGNTFEYINNIWSDISNDYKFLSKSSLVDGSYQELNLNSVQLYELHNLFASQNTQDRNIKLFGYLSLPFYPKFTMLQLNDGSPIWNRYSVHSGILDVFGFALNLNWTNFPIKGSFLPFTHYLIYSNTSNKHDIYKSTGTSWEKVLEKYYSNKIYHISPDGTKEILLNDENNKIKVDFLKTPGYHKLYTDDVEIEKIAVNINSQELQSQLLDFEAIKEFIPGNIEVISMNDDILSAIKQVRIGVELWRFFLYATILLLILEMIISNAKKQR
ncbi:MAG: hypothetical protein H8E85_00670 [Candidatus Marinimicrobia bacterium]|nr:hypothetical protein [Candidatus Neomarinimicrobiota bacterium]